MKYKYLYHVGLVLFIFAFAKCSSNLAQQADTELRHINSNTIVGDKKNTPLPYFREANTTVIYLVRHAEKASEESNDPALTQVGQQRATKLLKLLQDTELDAIFSTTYKRTQQTVQPTAESKRLTIQTYDAGALPAFAERLKTQYAGQRILVSGHSNTTPMLVNLLIGNEVYQAIEESDYGNFFIITLSENKTPQHVKMRF